MRAPSSRWVCVEKFETCVAVALAAGELVAIFWLIAGPDQSGTISANATTPTFLGMPDDRVLMDTRLFTMVFSIGRTLYISCVVMPCNAESPIWPSACTFARSGEHALDTKSSRHPVS